MKLGVLLPIGNNGWLISSTSPQFKPSSELTRDMTLKAERFGFDFALSMIKLRGFGGPSRYWDFNQENVTLMAGVMYTSDARSHAIFMATFFQMDSIGYNTRHAEAVNNELSWGELFNPKYRGKVALLGIDWLGMLDAALGMKALGLIDPVDITNLTNREVDTVAAFLIGKKREGHFRALWRAYGELVNLMASEEVWIADAWWPLVVEMASKGIPLRYAVAKEGYRAWCQGQAISATTRNLDACYEWLNFWLEGFAGARQTEIGYFSSIDTYSLYLPAETIRQVYGGEGRDGGSLEDRSQRVYVWNTRPTNLEYYTETWNEFLAA